ncbi:glutathione S-transferase theta-1 [Strongylocentrotus purpuratus]|uniref:glutathione transferase n=1 Tax=Strongylocentrotus purpuratus TaxID=7668 RepID=A0A7M7TH72_STRPU|nr:glutathione S-transferase theta-1 [Strongylocentrotus purpuratus]XP_030847851.1 glutathione S-transferase theta-1 [Strongylocentrotus purpuratus]XP_793199.3 glutathione S-transferase theta-1 [Strongylocentrotus purpuratus]|eukprot:XP_793199.3 PREDICTED: glutathione S-transferase theta-1 [Strongylocentrotus purpuratus]
MTVQLYVDMRSQPCRAVVMFLKLTDIPHELQYIDIFAGEHKKPEFADKFPLQTLPGLKDGDFYLGEMVAIFHYLIAKYANKIEDHWYPKDLEARARVDEYIAFHHTGTRGKCMALFVAEVFAPAKDKEKIKTEAKNLKQGLDKIETCFLKDNNFLCGNEISIGDIMAVCEFMQFTVNGRDIFKDNPKMKGHMDRVKARLQPTFDEIHAKIYAWGDSLPKDVSCRCLIM